MPTVHGNALMRRRVLSTTKACAEVSGHAVPALSSELKQQAAYPCHQRYLIREIFRVREGEQEWRTSCVLGT